MTLLYGFMIFLMYYSHKENLKTDIAFVSSVTIFVKAKVLYTSGPVSQQERLLYTLNKLFAKQVKSFLLLLDLDPFILQSSPHNIKYIKFTSP